MRNHAHPGCPHPVYGGDEVQARENRREPQDKDAQDGSRDIGRGADAVGGVKGPARVGRASFDEQGEQNDEGPRHIEPPGQSVDPREGHVLRADQDGEEDVPEGDGDPRDDEEEDLDDAVEGEELVVGLGIHEPSRIEEAQPDEEAQDNPHGEKGEQRPQVHDADALVVGGHHPLDDRPAVPTRSGVEAGPRRTCSFICAIHRSCDIGFP